MPLAEFGFSEFTEYELAREQGALLTLTDFDCVGEASASFDSLAVVSTSFSISGSSLALFVGTAVTNTNIAPPIFSGAVVEFFSGYTLNAAFNSQGKGTVVIHTGVKVPTEFHSFGRSTADFYISEGNEFFASGTSSALFAGASLASTSVEFSGATQVSFDATTVTLTKLQSFGSASVSFPAVTMGNGSLVSIGKSEAIFPAYKVAGTLMTIQGQASTDIRAAAVKATVLTSNAKGLFQPNTNATVFSAFNSVGLSQVDMHGTMEVLTQFDSMGKATVLFRPGSSVAKTIPRAYDVMIRPVEIRKVVWR